MADWICSSQRLIQATIFLATTRLLLLNWRTFDRTIGAVNTAITRFGFKQSTTLFTVIKELASIGWHVFSLSVAAMRASNGRFEDYTGVHGFLTVAG
jgi:hypothetical protein